jgi:pSer/pThr/pTyr-binding forkhead associated (FHA) protein
MKVELRGLPGPFFGRTFEVPVGSLTIGREKDCQLRIESGFVSRHHCIVLFDEREVRVRDLGSKNGTSINGSRVSATKEAVVGHGDLLTIGEVAFQFDFGPDAVRDLRPEPLPEGVAASQQTGSFSHDTVRTGPEVPSVPAAPGSPAVASNLDPKRFDTTLFPAPANAPGSPPAKS